MGHQYSQTEREAFYRMLLPPLPSLPALSLHQLFNPPGHSFLTESQPRVEKQLLNKPSEGPSSSSGSNTYWLCVLEISEPL